MAAHSATGPNRVSAAAARAAADASCQASASSASPRRGTAIPAVAAVPAVVRSRSAAVSAGSRTSCDRRRTSAASAGDPARPGEVAPDRAAADGTVRTEGGSSGHGVTHTTVCSPSASGPSASASAATAMSRCQPRPAVRTAPNSRDRSVPARASSESSAPIRAATSIAASS